MESRPLKMIEGIIGPRSRLVGKKVNTLKLREHYAVNVLAVHRQGIDLRKDLGEIKLAFGDTLLMEGPVSGINELQKEPDFVTLSEREPRNFPRRRGWVAASIAGAFVLGAALGVLPIAVLALLAALLMVVTGCLHSKHAYQAIHWEIIFLIFGMLALGKAMESSHAAEFIVDGVTTLFRDATPYVLLAALYLLCSILTELVTNNAVAALLAPISIASPLHWESTPPLPCRHHVRLQRQLHDPHRLSDQHLCLWRRRIPVHRLPENRPALEPHPVARRLLPHPHPLALPPLKPPPIMSEAPKPQPGLQSIHPRSLKHLTGYLQSLVRGRLWLKVMIGMALGITVGILLGPAVGWADPQVTTVIGDWLAFPENCFWRSSK